MEHSRSRMLEDVKAATIPDLSSVNETALMLAFSWIHSKTMS